MMFGALIKGENFDNYSIADGLLHSLIAIIIVFAILALIILCVNLLKLIKTKDEETKDSIVIPEQKKQLTIEDITDEDMMVAALIATIDYASETKKDVRLVSIKQIG